MSARATNMEVASIAHIALDFEFARHERLLSIQRPICEADERACIS